MAGSRKRKIVFEVFEKRRKTTDDRNGTRVFLGDSFTRWRALKTQQALPTDASVAKFLLDRLTSQRRDACADEWKSMNKSWGDSESEGDVWEENPVEEKEEEEWSVPKGTCQTMCPDSEMRQRESQRRLHHFEMLSGTQRDRRPRADPLRTVKEYSRPAAGKDSTNPTDLRPPDVLIETVGHLIHNIVTDPHLHPWTEVYSFVFDRLRAVKQDMIIQRLSGKDCVTVLEQTVRFLVYASYRLCGEPLRHFDPKINDMHVQENLRWLLDCYSSGQTPSDNQEEFEAINLLYNLGCTQVLQRVLELPKGLQNSPNIFLARSINCAYLERNPVRLLRLAQKLNFLQSCALHRHLPAIRRDLLLIYSHGFSSRNCRFPLEKLCQLLNLHQSYTTEYCQMYGVKVNQENQVLFRKNTMKEELEPRKVQCLQHHDDSAEKLKRVGFFS